MGGSGCFVTGEQKIDDFKYLLNVLLVKSDGQNTENDRFFKFELSTSYEQLKVINDTLRRLYNKKEDIKIVRKDLLVDTALLIDQEEKYGEQYDEEVCKVKD